MMLVFTFHYVSIKSSSPSVVSDRIGDLHSTMYLLNPGDKSKIQGYNVFTFHYVSIKSFPSPVCSLL